MPKNPEKNHIIIYFLLLLLLSLTSKIFSIFKCLFLDPRFTSVRSDSLLGGAAQGWAGVGHHSPRHRLQLAPGADDAQPHLPLRKW